MLLTFFVEVELKEKKQFRKFHVLDIPQEEVKKMVVDKACTGIQVFDPIYPSLLIPPTMTDARGHIYNLLFLKFIDVPNELYVLCKLSSKHDVPIPPISK